MSGCISYSNETAHPFGWVIYFMGERMNNLNSILIEGNLTKTPNFRTTPNGTPLCMFSIASNRYFKQDSELEKEVSFFDVESWGNLAEQVNNLGHKGRGIRVVGRLKQDRWNDGEGKTKSRVVIIAEHVEFRPEFPKKAEDSGGETEAVETPEEEAVFAPTF
jgi:single-strand DNA-binding protein